MKKKFRRRSRSKIHFNFEKILVEFFEVDGVEINDRNTDFKYWKTKFLNDILTFQVKQFLCILIKIKVMYFLNKFKHVKPLRCTEM